MQCAVYTFSLHSIHSTVGHMEKEPESKTPPTPTLVSRASHSTSVLGGKERLVTFARYSWHVGMQLLRDVIAYTFAPTCFDEMFA